MAEDDEDEWIDTRILRGILKGVGLRRGDEAGIDYRERSPLVVPPSRSLPPPESANVAAQNPAWPVDADVQRRKQASAKRRRGRANGMSEIEAESYPLPASQLSKRGPAGSGQYPTRTTEQGTDQSSQAELKSVRNLFTWTRMFGGSKDESVPFTGEPDRTILTQPPPGYQTPSPSYPYGLGKPSVAENKPATIEDRAAREER
ncbi:MAG: hypothetical protein HY056_02190 [Proteobacteria bacterium]|nr:hypothetical protein [Pseudomonadota bacterium]